MKSIAGKPKHDVVSHLYAKARHLFMPVRELLRLNNAAMKSAICDNRLQLENDYVGEDAINYQVSPVGGVMPAMRESEPPFR